MGVSYTSRLGLAKHVQGDGAWHTGLNAGMDNAEARFLKFGAGTPIGTVAPNFDGQPYYDTTGNVLWVSTGLTNADWIRVGGTFVGAEAQILALNVVQYSQVIARASDTGALWGVVSGAWTMLGRPSSPEVYDSSSSTYQQLLTASWATLTTNGTDSMNITLLLPQLPTYAIWIVEVEAKVWLYDANGNRRVATRLVKDIGAGPTYPMTNAPGACNETGMSVPLYDRIYNPAHGSAWTYTYTVEVGMADAGPGGYANYRSAGAGPGGTTYPKSYIKGKLFRVDR